MNEGLAVASIVLSSVAIVAVGFHVLSTLLTGSIQRSINDSNHEMFKNHKAAIEPMQDRVRRIGKALEMVEGQAKSSRLDRIEEDAISSRCQVEDARTDLDSLYEGLRGATLVNRATGGDA